MDRRSKLVAAALLLCAGAAQAYVSPSPPPGFGGSPGNWTFAPSSPADQLGKIMRGPGPSVAGSGPISAAYRLGPGAARALAKGVIGGGVAGALLLGGLWLAQNCFEKQNDQWVRTCGPAGTPPPQSTSGQTAEYAVSGAVMAYWPTQELACKDPGYPAAFMKAYSGMVAVTSVTFFAPATCRTFWRHSNGNSGYWDQGISVRAKQCPTGWYYTTAGCIQTLPVVPVPPQVVEDEMAEKPLPQKLPPGIPYPLDPAAPSIWNPTIGDPPVTQPLRVPQGNPRPVPNTNPQRYRQPVTDITHSPTLDDPWRMDVQPKDIDSDSPTGQTGPQTITSGAPSGTPKEDPPDLCETNPDIVACQKLGNLDPLNVPNTNRQMGIAPDTGYGPSSASCPAPKTATIMGKVYTFPWTVFCDFALMIRPLLIGFAWLSAALTFMGLSRKD